MLKFGKHEVKIIKKKTFAERIIEARVAYLVGKSVKVFRFACVGNTALITKLNLFCVE